MSLRARARRRNAWIALAVWLALALLGFPLRSCSPDRPPSDPDVARLRQELVTAQEENVALRQRVSLLAELPEELAGYEPLPALLSAFRDLSPDRSSAMIDVGRIHGVRPHFGVIAQGGLVGKVIEVGERRSRVAFADDPSFRVHFRLAGRDGEGVAVGGMGPGVLAPSFLRDRIEFEPGDILVTAGEAGVFPRGIVVGTIESVGETPAGTRVRLPVDRTELRSVAVLCPPGLGRKR